MINSKMQINFENIIYIIGNQNSCFAFNTDKSITEIKESVKKLCCKLKEQNYIQVNNYTLINTKYYVLKENKQRIKMSDSSLHKLFRRQYKNFKENHMAKGDK